MTERDEPGAGEVLRSLPSRRPQRRSARRDAASKPAAAKPGARKATPASPKPKAKPSAPKAKAKAAASAGKPKGVRPSAATRAASSTPGERPAHPPQGVELLGTAVQAAGELAQLGLSLGTRALRGALERLPRP